MTEIQRYPTGRSNAEDVCQRVTYSYDTNPYNSGFGANSQARLTAASYGPVNSAQSCIPGVAPISYVEMYSYAAPGAITVKRLQGTRNSIRKAPSRRLCHRPFAVVLWASQVHRVKLMNWPWFLGRTRGL